MANLDRPMGFRVYKTISGAPVSQHYYTLSSTNSRIAPGDFVVKDSAGRVNLFTGAESLDLIIGIAAELKAASAGGQIALWDNLQDLLLYAQTDDGTGTLTAETAKNLNASILATASGTSRHSLMEIDENSGATTSTLALKIIDLLQAPDNEYGQYNRFVVKMNRHADAVNVVGV